MRDEAGRLSGPDVCVVGAGPAGLALARALGNTGRTVTVLESGGFLPSLPTQDLNEGEVLGEPYAGLQQTRHRRVGGTTNIWNVVVDHQAGAKYVPLSRRDLEAWPIGWEELEPFYREAQEVCGLGPFEYGAEAWATDGRSPFDLTGTGLTSGVYQFGSADRFSLDLVGELQRMENVRLVSSSTVVGLSIDAAGQRVRSLRVAPVSGQPFDVEARTFVLACGAVENTRLLLLAGAGGRGGSSWLGRGFMEHARDFSLVLVPDSPEVFERAHFYDFHVGAGGVRIGGRLTLTDDALSSLDLPSASLTLVPRVGAGKRPSRESRVDPEAVGVPRVGNRKRYGWSTQEPARRFDVFGMVMNLEQRPHLENRIELGEARDRFGNPLPRLHLHWTAEEQDRLDRLRVHLGEWFRSAGLGKLRIQRGRHPDLSAHHHAGTTRMADHPNDGVTDPEGRVFGVKNLYVTGASLFPTAGFANPTLTVVALALRLARYLGAGESSAEGV